MLEDLQMIIAFIYLYLLIARCTRGVSVVFSVTRMQSSNSVHMNKSDFTIEKIE